MRLGAEHMARAGESPLGNVTSIAFGGPGRRTAYLGSLLNDHVLVLELPVAGAA